MACMWTVKESSQESESFHSLGDESSSCYMSLSQLLYEDKRYYDRIRLAIAWVYSELLKMENHPNLKKQTLFTKKFFENFEKANLIKAEVDASFYPKEGIIQGDLTIKLHDNELLEHKNICQVQLQFALEKTVDISDFGLEIFCSMLSCDIHILQSLSRQKKLFAWTKLQKIMGGFGMENYNKNVWKAHHLQQNTEGVYVCQESYQKKHCVASISERERQIH